MDNFFTNCYSLRKIVFNKNFVFKLNFVTFLNSTTLYSLCQVDFSKVKITNASLFQGFDGTQMNITFSQTDEQSLRSSYSNLFRKCSNNEILYTDGTCGVDQCENSFQQCLACTTACPSKKIYKEKCVPYCPDTFTVDNTTNQCVCPTNQKVINLGEIEKCVNNFEIKEMEANLILNESKTYTFSLGETNIKINEEINFNLLVDLVKKNVPCLINTNGEIRCTFSFDNLEIQSFNFPDYFDQQENYIIDIRNSYFIAKNQKECEENSTIDCRESCYCCEDPYGLIKDTTQLVCSRCKEGYYPNSITDYDCWNEKTKPENYYLDEMDFTYKECHYSCKTCNGLGDSTNNRCTSCHDEFILKLVSSEDLNIGNCVDESQCFERCSSCIEKGTDLTNQKCSLCKSNYFFNEDGNCFDSSCTEGYFYNETSGKCLKCFSSCQSCNSSGVLENNNCISCKAGFNYEEISSNCLPDGTTYRWYKNEKENNYTLLGKNENCPSNYPALLTSKNQCLLNCQDDGNNLYIYSNVCYDTCPEGFTKDENKKECFCDFEVKYDENGNLLCEEVKVEEEEKVEEKIEEKEEEKEEEKVEEKIEEKVEEKEEEKVEEKEEEKVEEVKVKETCFESCLICPELITESSQTESITLPVGVSQECYSCDTEKGYYSVLIDNKTYCNLSEVISGYSFNSEEKIFIKLEGCETEAQCLSKSLENYVENLIENLVENNTNETVIFEAAEYSKDGINENFSKVDLGDCENILKEKNGIPLNESLIILQIEKNGTQDLISKVNYDIYAKNGTKLDLAVCQDVPITVESKINTEAMPDLFTNVNRAAEQGYDIFNTNSSFYNDLCTPYTSADGTDMILKDRTNMLPTNLSLCNEGCQYDGFDPETNRVKCTCTIITEENKEDNIDKNKISLGNLKDQLKNTLLGSNVKSIKCYKLVFSNRVKDNKGFFIAMALFIAGGFSSIFVIKAGTTPLLSSLISFGWAHSALNFFSGQKVFEILHFPEHFKNIKPEKVEVKQKSKKKKHHHEPPKKSHKKEKYLNDREKINYGKSKRRKVSNDIEEDNDDYVSHKKHSDNNKESENRKIKEKSSLRKQKTKGETNNQLNVNNEIKGDEEINYMTLEQALIYDKRTFLQLYWNYLKYTQQLIFTFYTKSDFNVRFLKIVLFFYSILLYLAVNILFFTDESMTHNYEQKGKYDFFYSLPKIIYSTIITQAFTMVIKMLSLSKSTIEAIIYANKTNVEKLNEMAIYLNKTFKIKLTVFFILLFLTAAFFWYFIAAFCAVYKNTQSNWLTSSFTSFAISMAYPFGISIGGALIRIMALKCKSNFLLFCSRLLC